MKFLNRLLLEATSNSFGLIFFICHDFLQKLQQNYLVIKWSCYVCIGICFYVYMVYSLMACLNYIASVLCIVCLFFLCAYTEWNGTKKLFAFLMKSSLNYTRAALLFWNGTLELFVQLGKYSSCLGVHVLFCHYACLSHWRASLPILVGNPGNGPVGEINLSTVYCAVLPLQRKLVAQCVK